MEMWRACRLLNSWRRLAVMTASSPTRVSGSWSCYAGELMDWFEFPDILQQWKTQRGSWQKAAWVWRCSTGGVFFFVVLRRFFFVGVGWIGASRSHVGG